MGASGGPLCLPPRCIHCPCLPLQLFAVVVIRHGHDRVYLRSIASLVARSRHVVARLLWASLCAGNRRISSYSQDRKGFDGGKGAWTRGRRGMGRCDGEGDFSEPLVSPGSSLFPVIISVPPFCPTSEEGLHTRTMMRTDLAFRPHPLAIPQRCCTPPPTWGAQRRLSRPLSRVWPASASALASQTELSQSRPSMAGESVLKIPRKPDGAGSRPRDGLNATTPN